MYVVRVALKRHVFPQNDVKEKFRFLLLKVGDLCVTLTKFGTNQVCFMFLEKSHSEKE